MPSKKTSITRTNIPFRTTRKTPAGNRRKLPQQVQGNEGLENWRKRVLARKPTRIRIPPKGANIITIQRWREEQSFHDVFRTCHTIVNSELLTVKERQRIQAFNKVLDSVLKYWWKNVKTAPVSIGQAVDLNIIGRQKWAQQWRKQVMENIGPVFNIVVRIQQTRYPNPSPKKPA